LCLKHSLRDPWPALLYINLESSAPQSGGAPAIGRSERGSVTKCLDELESASRRAETSEPDEKASKKASGKRTVLQRIVDFFV
jgi:hypothetical protein